MKYLLINKKLLKIMIKMYLYPPPDTQKKKRAHKSQEFNRSINIWFSILNITLKYRTRNINEAGGFLTVQAVYNWSFANNSKY